MYPEPGLLDHMVFLFLMLLRKLHTIFQSYYTTRNTCSLFSTSLLTLVILTVNFLKGWGNISLQFWFASPWLLKMLNTFLYTCLFICISSLDKMSIQILCPFLIIWWWWYDYFGYWVVWVSCILWILIPYQIHSLQIFPPSLGCLLILFKKFFIQIRLKVINFLSDVVQIVYLWFCCLCFCYHVQKLVSWPMSSSLLLCFLVEVNDFLSHSCL